MFRIKKTSAQFFVLFFLILGSVAVFSQTLQEVSEGADKIREIRKRGYLVAGMTAQDQYPFYYTNRRGEFTGLDVDIVRTVATMLDVGFRVNRDAQSFGDLIPLVVNKKIDFVASKLSMTLSRSQRVLYTRPYIIFRQALLLNRLQLAKAGINDKKIQSFLRNFNATIGVIKNSSYEGYAANNFPRAKILPFDTWEEAVSAGEQGKVFTIYRDELEIFKIIQESPSNNLILRPVILKDQTDPIAVALHADDAHFLFFLNMVLDSMNIEQNLQKLTAQYRP